MAATLLRNFWHLKQILLTPMKDPLSTSQNAVDRVGMAAT